MPSGLFLDPKTDYLVSPELGRQLQTQIVGIHPVESAFVLGKPDHWESGFNTNFASLYSHPGTKDKLPPELKSDPQKAAGFLYFRFMELQYLGKTVADNITASLSDNLVQRHASRMPCDWEGLSQSSEFSTIMKNEPFVLAGRYQSNETQQSSATFFVNRFISEEVFAFLEQDYREQIGKMEQETGVGFFEYCRRVRNGNGV